jgi:hypothetical protein
VLRDVLRARVQLGARAPGRAGGPCDTGSRVGARGAHLCVLVNNEIRFLESFSINKTSPPVCTCQQRNTLPREFQNQ